MPIVDRNGRELGIALCDEGGRERKVEDMADYTLLCSAFEIRKTLPYIARALALRLDFRGAYLLFLITAKHHMGKNNFRERIELSGRLSPVRYPEVRLTSMGKLLVFKTTGPGVAAVMKMIKETFISNQYDISKRNIRGRVVIDAGANIGVFSVAAARFSPKKIYAFEPVAETYKLLEENIRANRLENVVIPVNKALGSRDFSAKIRYSASGDTMAAISPGNPAGSQRTEVVTLDGFLKGGEAGFIKADVEGYESQVLLGAKETIRKYKPALSISAYHAPPDKEKLPELILGIRGDYRITLDEYEEADIHCE